MDWRREGQYSAGNIDHKYTDGRNMQEVQRGGGVSRGFINPSELLSCDMDSCRIIDTPLFGSPSCLDKTTAKYALLSMITDFR